ncbi:serine aminopeptidase domain-containing protein [Paenibacillus tuaregi]|uniref:serine aminopeptidase domain-containing protein n=1 Tax=Paenibacillus tuaregi TaxID=1816681 RepID=UPI0008383341|nr:alpha/beta hydrolase [Paenibacillus tuaregi]
MPIDFNIRLDEANLLRCTRYPSKEARPQSLIILAPGFKGFKDWGMFPYVAEQFSRQHEVITFNFSHNGIGESPTEFTELDKFAVNTYDRELRDLEALHTYIRQDPSLSALPLFLIGHSRGAGVCLVYGFDHPRTLAGVLSWNGLTKLDLFNEQQKKEMREQGRSHVVNARTGQRMPLDVVILEDLEQQKDRYHIMNRIGLADFAVALIQGTEDHLLEGSRKLVEANPHIPWILIEGANHTFNTTHPFQGASRQLKDAINASELFISDVLRKRG